MRREVEMKRGREVEMRRGREVGMRREEGRLRWWKKGG